MRAQSRSISACSVRREGLTAASSLVHERIERAMPYS